MIVRLVGLKLVIASKNVVHDTLSGKWKSSIVPLGKDYIDYKEKASFLGLQVEDLPPVL